MNTYSKRQESSIKFYLYSLYKILSIIFVLISIQSCTNRPQTQGNTLGSEINRETLYETVEVYIPETVFVPVKDTLNLDLIQLKTFLLKFKNTKKGKEKNKTLKSLQNGDKLFLTERNIKHLELKVEFQLSSYSPSPCCKCSALPVEVSISTIEENPLISREYTTNLGKEISFTIPLNQLLVDKRGESLTVSIETEKISNNKCEFAREYKKSLEFSLNIIKGVEIDDTIYFPLGKTITLTPGEHIIKPIISGPDSIIDLVKTITIHKGATKRFKKVLNFEAPTGEFIKLPLHFKIANLKPSIVCRNVILRIISLNYSNNLMQSKKIDVTNDTIIFKSVKLPPIENKFEIIAKKDTIYRNIKGVFPGENIIPLRINCATENQNKRLIVYGLDTLYLDYLTPHKKLNIFYKPGLILGTNGEVLFNVICKGKSRQIRLSVDRHRYIELGKILGSRYPGVCKLEILEKR